MAVESQKVKDFESKRMGGEEFIRMYREKQSQLRQKGWIRQTENSKGRKPTDMESANTGDVKREKGERCPHLSWHPSPASCLIRQKLP